MLGCVHQNVLMSVCVICVLKGGIGVSVPVLLDVYDPVTYTVWCSGLPLCACMCCAVPRRLDVSLS